MGVELRDNRGLICGFLLAQEQAPTPIDGALVAFTAPPPGEAVWLHFNLNDTRARRWIADCPWLPPEAKELFLSADSQVRLEVTGEGIAATLADVHADDPDSFGVFRLFLGPRLLLTGRRHPEESLGLLRQDLVNGMAFAGPNGLLLRLIDHLLATFGKLVFSCSQAVDEAEDAVLAGQYGQHTLGSIRRLMARLRRHLTCNRQALTELASQPLLGKADAKQLRRSIDRWGAMLQDLELVQERARLLDDEVNNRLATATNRNLFFLSVVMTLFLPLTLFTGVFGMNVAGLPWLEDPNGFLWTMFCMAVILVVSLWVLRARDIL